MGGSSGKEVKTDDEAEPRVVGDAPQHGGGCHYLLMVLLFLAHVVLVLGLAISWWSDMGDDLNERLQTLYDAETNTFHLIEKVILYSSISSVLFVFLYYVLMRFCATVFIFTSQIALVVTLGSMGAACFYESSVADETGDVTIAILLGALSLILASIVFLWMCCNWKQLRATGAMISHVSGVLTAQPGPLVIQFVLTGLAVFWIFICASATLEAVLLVPEAGEVYGDEGDEDSLSEGEYYGATYGIVLYGFLVLFWGSLVITNISVVTTCGLVGTWYHDPGYLDKGGIGCKPAVWGAFKRACTNFLGSIVLGSLLLAIVRTVIVAVRYLAEKFGKESAVLKFACCCILCCLGCFEKCLEWLSEYAFAYMAVYGTPFVTSGVRVVGILTKSGMTAVGQTFLTGTMIRFGDLLGLVLGAAVGWLVEAEDQDSSSSGEEAVWVAMATGAVIGVVITDIGLALLSAGVKTIFVCCAEDPQVLWSRDPELARLLNLEGGPAGAAVEVDLARP